jgi:EAL domain-containing protein (putative c-di-GMP-specific phosphodiesterase class I)
MYRAKSVRSGAEVYAQVRDTHSRDRLTLLSDLRRALDAGEIVVHYQPQGDAMTGEIAGVEALVRWQHPEHGLLTPAHFLPVAEQTGLMRPLTLDVLGQSLAQAAAWQADGLALRLSVNLAVVNMIDRQLPADIEAMLSRHGVEPGSLTLEVTENIVMADPDRAAAILAQLRAMGVGVALDDFGTGHSSLAWLKTLPVDELKIDRAFVKDVLIDPSAAAIVRATLDLARAFSLRTVAEGAEDEDTWARLAAFGCDLVQGYVLTPPLPADELAVWLSTRRMVGTTAAARLSS